MQSDFSLEVQPSEVFEGDSVTLFRLDASIRIDWSASREIADIVDAANTYAVFVWGPDGIKLEYVEHKPTFSLV